MGISAKPLNKKYSNEIKPIKAEDKKRKKEETAGFMIKEWGKGKKTVMKQEKKPVNQARANEAAAHTEEMEREYGEQIKECKDRSQIFGAFIPDFRIAAPYGKYTISVIDEDSVTAVLKGKGKRQCILNFASYKHPGGGFLNGSVAQEEALCHESFLYNILLQFMDDFYTENTKYPNWSMYSNRSIYSPDVVFVRGEDEAYSDVLTCACPNWKDAAKYGFTEEENERTVRQRINYLLKVIATHDIEQMILGAFGCGAFGQNATVVARIFHEEIFRVLHGRKMEIIFAIPSGNGNLEIFKDEMEKEINWSDVQNLDWRPVRKPKE